MVFGLSVSKTTGPKKEKYPESSSSQGENALLMSETREESPELIGKQQ